MYLKGSYTVEGSGVIAICMIVIGMCIMLAFNIYRESEDYFINHPVKEIDCVETFKKIRAGEAVIDLIKEALNGN